MSEWKSIHINKQNIEYDTGKAALIKAPNKSKYAGYKFWHPSKLIRSGNHSYDYTLSYTDDFTFKLTKYGEGKWNKQEVIREVQLNSKEFEELYNISNELEDDESYESEEDYDTDDLSGKSTDDYEL